uniref:Uncharacterized protein n=1 Tax=Kalanchoe fedtschenkoi TaxID=63787 RepID=A0A7N0VG74_KALFE
MIASSNSSFSDQEALRCHETFFSDQDMDDGLQEETCSAQTPPNPSSPEPLRTHGKDGLRDDLGELQNLLSRERRDQETRRRIFVRRTEAVRWIVRASCHHGFSTLTSVLAIDYFDRFVARTLFPQDVAWAVQLAAVACLSLAAKVEETRVPLLVDLQEVAETAELVFEAGTVRRMELVILSLLEWRMNPVTPLSFLHHFLNTCQQQLKNHTHLLHFEFVEDLILSVVSDSRFMCYLPSTLAMAAVLHVLDGAQLSNGIECRKRVMSVLNFSDEVSFEIIRECYELVQEVSFHHRQNGNDGTATAGTSTPTTARTRQGSATPTTPAGSAPAESRPEPSTLSRPFN